MEFTKMNPKLKDNKHLSWLHLNHFYINQEAFQVSPNDKNIKHVK